MNVVSQLAQSELFGLYEVNETGTVLYSRLRRHNALVDAKPAMVGQNFFKDVLPFENAADFRRRFEKFLESHDSSHNFIFDCRFRKSVIQVKVLLTRISETKGGLRFVIVDIRKLEPVSRIRI